MKNDTKYSRLFDSLDKTVNEFIEEVTRQKLHNMATDKWTVKDVLCHIAFWHRYYAQNYASLADGEKPYVFPSKGGSTRNQDGVQSLNRKSRMELFRIIKNSQDSLRKSIVVSHVPEMNYIGSTKYSTEDFLKIVTGHIGRHTIQVKRAKLCKPEN